MRAVVDAIGTDAVERDDLRRLLGELVHAVVARAIEEGALDFPADHPFWGHFGRRQGREITRALASYGFRFDGRGGFVDGRVPSRRELSVVIGQAGLDPMRVRRWPEEPGRLFEGATVAAGEFLATGAPSLSLAEMVALLGQRPEALDELWNAWGRIGPRLLEPLPRRAPSA